MLPPEDIDALNILVQSAVEPATEFLIKDIARRISEAGKFTSTAAYQMFKAQELGKSQKKIIKRLSKILDMSEKDIKKLIEKSAQEGYSYDVSRLGKKGIPFKDNESLQQILKAALKLAEDDFKNITQTLGMIDPFGNPMPLKDAYNSYCDYAFNLVSTGAADYNTAIARACKALAEKGVRFIDYESGISTSLEAAVRRNIMGGLGLMQEKISQENHDSLGADGWEISAHAMCAPDHEPIQGRQYTDEEYRKLNESLTRRIGTLNCGHAAFPIKIGVSKPVYTDEQLEKFKSDNKEGITYEGRHYSLYEATQKQRRIERTIRTQKRRILALESAGITDDLQIAQIKYRRLNEEYERFSKAVGLKTKWERSYVEGFTPKHGKAAAKAYEIEKIKKEEYNRTCNKIKEDIKSKNLKLNIGNQNKHIRSSKGYKDKSYILFTLDEAQELVNKYHGKGEIKLDRNMNWSNKEFVMTDSVIGAVVDRETKEETFTRRFSIHYGKRGTHIVPAKEKRYEDKSSRRQKG